MHIDNLYKDQDILMFKQCYAMEKIHGTSARISYKNGRIAFFSGGEKHEKFVMLFDEDYLKEKFDEMVSESKTSIAVYGEAYGGSCQRMSHTYGDKLKFVAFEVKIGDAWLNVPNAEDVCNNLCLDFVHYKLISTDLSEIDAERDAYSVQAVKNGVGECRHREGIVLRPLTELTKNNGKRVIAKHKRAEFQETKTTREVDPKKQEVLAEAKAVAEEWVTPMRLSHILDKIEEPRIEKMSEIIKAMTKDIEREGEGEIVWSKEVKKEIGSRTAQLVKLIFNERYFS